MDVYKNADARGQVPLHRVRGMRQPLDQVINRYQSGSVGQRRTELRVQLGVATTHATPPRCTRCVNVGLGPLQPHIMVDDRQRLQGHRCVLRQQRCRYPQHDNDEDTGRHREPLRVSRCNL
ncbi:hypothetical protein H7X69_01370 [Candidatus Saccharibacteria bacterium]|nr:hypothetical protein [Candidatus Saccharibacteria bacterium]